MRPINWNSVTDDLDKQVWDRLTANFWLPEKVPVANDLQTWNRLSDEEQRLIKRVFASLTMLDTLQGNEGAPTLHEWADTDHARAVYANITFMEHVHAKSYSTIFSTLCSTEEINQLFRWAEEDDLLQAQVKAIWTAYTYSDMPVLMAASVFLESMLFYTGFYAPLRMAAEGRLTNTADIIRLILRDEGVHGFYIGAKAQKQPDYTDCRDDIYQLLMVLYDRELKRCEQLYDEVGWTEEVKNFLRYNANKALANLGLEPAFGSHQTQIPAYILAALDPSTGENHDFFSGSGASYVIGKAEETTEEDWDW